MCVNPGFAGQDMMPNMPNKLKKIREAYPNLKLEVDGHITPEYYEEFKALGVEDFVVGTSLIFKGSAEKTEEIIKTIKIE